MLTIARARTTRRKGGGGRDVASFIGLRQARLILARFRSCTLIHYQRAAIQLGSQALQALLPIATRSSKMRKEDGERHETPIHIFREKIPRIQLTSSDYDSSIDEILGSTP